MIRVFLVDDHELFRAGVRSILQGREDLVVVGEFANGEDTVAAVRTEAPDLILMDVNMPGIGGIEATRKVLRSAPEVRVIAVTVLSDDPFPNHLLDAGALGYLSKGSGTDEMLEAIDTVMRGRHFISRDVAQKLAIAGFTNRDPSPLSVLSPREMQIMMMIVNGQRNQEISDSLLLSPKTVSTYRHRLYEKLDVSNDVELTHFAIRYGVVDSAQ